MSLFACGCFFGPRQLEVLCFNRRFWVKLKDRSKRKAQTEEISNKDTSCSNCSRSKEATAEAPKMANAAEPGDGTCYAKLRRAYPNAPAAELARFSLCWRQPDAVLAYQAHLRWRQDEGSASSLAQARGCIPKEWLSRGSKAKDGSDVLFLQVAQTDCSIAPETYFKALCSYLDELAPKENAMDFQRITVFLDTRGGEGWSNPPATHLLPLLRVCTRQLPVNFPGVLQRIVVYPVPVALKFFVSLCLALVDTNTRSRCVLISEKTEGGVEAALQEYVCSWAFDGKPARELAYQKDGVAASEPPEKGSFTVKLELEELKPRMLGVSLDSTEERGLLIVGFFDGVLSKYNEKFPRQAIRKFDKITAVNGKVGNANDLRRIMVSAIADETLETLALTLRRPVEFEVCVRRPGPLGIQVNYTDLLGGVLITKVVPDGLVDRWNAENLEEGKSVNAGDRIIALNNSELRGDDLVDKLKNDEELRLTVLHY
ncbi:unnamed protein product [Symbiodinium sp. CCMP2592]|nr:unnamed protein product [Symbiodinium sp. CCMP2592]